ncbi:MAG: threonine/serine exporter family protein [Eubacteriales bacterium]|nr:threonine/serine exporter family protein [Eubacteriales bacterium]
MDNNERMLGLLLDIGEVMIKNGSEVKRVEETITLMGRAYGADKMDVFVITSSIVVTMNFHNDKSVSRTRRILQSPITDFKKLENINDLSRRYCCDAFSLDELEKELKKINNAEIRLHRRCIGGMLLTGTLTIFYGGNIKDGIIAMLVALIICILQKYFAPLCTNTVFFNFLCSFVAGVLICVISRVISVNIDKIMIGDIMLLIPGIALTNSVKDVFVGDTISGIMRLAESFMWAGALACGFMLSFWINTMI